MTYGNIESGVFAPEYYNSFKCIADKCRHSCCIDWEICIDGETLEKYRANDEIMKTVTEEDDVASFALTEEGRCPHLNESGLCEIIISHGDGHLCDICRNHPRFFNDLGGGRVEAGLGIVCEEACRLVLESRGPFSLAKLFDVEMLDGDGPDFVSLAKRDEIIRVIEETQDFDVCLSMLQQRFGIGEVHTPDEWRDIFLSLEILKDDWRETLESLEGTGVRDGEYEEYYRRLLTYFVYRHVSIAEGEADLKARLAFAMLSVQMIRRVFESNAERSLEKLTDAARRYSAEIEYSEENTEELIFELELLQTNRGEYENDICTKRN